MLGILLIYFMAKPFYKLADAYGKSKWGYAILVVAIYFGGQIVTGVVLGLLAPELFHNEDKATEVLLNLGGVVIGALAVWLTYKLLKQNWLKQGELAEKFSNEEFIDTDEF